MLLEPNYLSLHPPDLLYPQLERLDLDPLVLSGFLDARCLGLEMAEVMVRSDLRQIL